MRKKRADVVIVGTGHAGTQAAIALRQQGHTGSIRMISCDREPPYERPPLSKEYLSGERAFERMYLRPPGFWAEQAIDLQLSANVDSVDPVAQTVRLSTGEVVGYGVLVWAAGGHARMLDCPGADLRGVHAVRDKADVDGMLADLLRGMRKVVVIGGGYIGLEVSAVLTKLGCAVTLFEALPRVLARVTGEELSRFYEHEHRRRGVDLSVSTNVQTIEGVNGQVTSVHLANGQIVACDMVVVGIGIAPAVEPLALAGAKVSNGVEVDDYCRTNLPNIYAIGDCAAHHNRFADNALLRLESVQNANDMAVTAAKAICGKPEPYAAVPWFWSNQFDLKLQTIGLSAGHDSAVLRRGSTSGGFSVVYLKSGRVITLDCVNAMKDFVQGRKLVEVGSRAKPEQLASSDVPLKELLAHEGTAG